MTNLYGWSVSQFLPAGDFHVLNLSNKTSLSKSILRTPDNEEHGFLLECDLEYPSDIHEKQKFSTFAQKKRLK